MLRLSVWLVLPAGVTGTHPSLTRVLVGYRRKMAQALVRGRFPAHADGYVEPHSDAHVSYLEHRLSAQRYLKWADSVSVQIIVGWYHWTAAGRIFDGAREVPADSQGPLSADYHHRPQRAAYQNLETTKVVAAISRSTRIPADHLVQPITSGPNKQRGHLGPSPGRHPPHHVVLSGILSIILRAR